MAEPSRIGDAQRVSHEALGVGANVPSVGILGFWQSQPADRRELYVDIAIAVGLTVFCCAQAALTETLFVGLSAFGEVVQGSVRYGLSPLLLVLIACCMLPLALRRRYTVAVLCCAVLFCAVIQAMQGMSFAIAAPALMLYTYASFDDAKPSWVVCACMCAALLLVDAFASPPSALLLGIENVAVLVTACALGIAHAMRSRLLSETEERARQAERAAAEAVRTREEEAARRVEQERVAIAREVHDITAHALAAVSVQAGAAERLVDTDPARAKEAMREVRGVSKDSLAELRSLLAVLREPRGGAELAPTQGTEKLHEVVEFLEQAGCGVQVDTGAYDRTAVAGFVDVALYRIVREAATNVVKHAPASDVLMTLGCDARMAWAQVLNGPAGARADARAGALPAGEFAAVPGGGHGIEGMRQRALALGGEFEFGHAQWPKAGDEGFRVHASIPARGGVAAGAEGEGSL